MDLQFAVKELMRRLAKPKEGDGVALKRVARYLLTAPRVVSTYPWQKLSSELVI